MFIPHSAKCEYQLDFTAKDKPIGIATIYHPAQVIYHVVYKQFQKDGYKFYKIGKLTIITYN